jgi:galactokinase
MVSAECMDHEVLHRALQRAKARWGIEWQPDVIASAPGRIELLGNHLDYNGGRVLAAAIDRRTVVLGRNRAFTGEPFAVEFADYPSETLAASESHGAHPDGRAPQPIDYFRGAIRAAEQAERSPSEGEYTVASSVPAGVGVSSSAALCVALTLAMHPSRPPNTDLILLAQQAEHLAGSPCGTMDQAASVQGGLLLFDPQTLTSTGVAPVPDAVGFLVVSSGIVRSLATSSYPDRVRECRLLREIATKTLGREIASLASLDPADVQIMESSGVFEGTPELHGRLQHILSESRRVPAGIEAIERQDWRGFGALMTESGRSSAIDYEISHPRVEELVREILEMNGVYGARMMGGGEGGSVVALIEPVAAPEIRTALSRGYFERYGLDGEPGSDNILIARIRSGASVERHVQQSGAGEP